MIQKSRNLESFLNFDNFLELFSFPRAQISALVYFCSDNGFF